MSPAPMYVTKDTDFLKLGVERGEGMDSVDLLLILVEVSFVTVGHQVHVSAVTRF